MSVLEDTNEDYFDSLLCIECRRNYFSDLESKLCSKCKRKAISNKNKKGLDSIMKQKSKPFYNRKDEMIKGLKANMRG